MMDPMMIIFATNHFNVNKIRHRSRESSNQSFHSVPLTKVDRDSPWPNRFRVIECLKWQSQKFASTGALTSEMSLLVDKKNPKSARNLATDSKRVWHLGRNRFCWNKIQWSNDMRNVSGNSQEQNSNHQKFSAYITFSMISFSFLVLFSRGTILLHQRDVPKQILIEYDQ